MNNFKLIAIGHLYSPWNGTLREFTGEVYHRDEKRFAREICTERTYFLVRDKCGREIKKLDCAPHEGEVHNKVLWLTERDPRKAAGILIEYEETQISKLRFQIENHERLIETLKTI